MNFRILTGCLLCHVTALACLAPASYAQNIEPDLNIDDFSALQTSPPTEGSPTSDAPSPMPTVLSEDIAPAARDAFAQGEELAAQGNAAAALAAFNRAVEADPTFALGFLARARVLAELGQTRSAAKSLTSGLNVAKTPNARGAIYLERGKLYQSDGQYAKALDDFDSAFELAPANAEVAYGRGSALRYLAAEDFAIGDAGAGDRMRQALAAFDRAIELNGEHVDALADRASVRADLGQIDEAMDDLAKAAALRPADALLQFRLAALHLRRASADDAQSDAATAARREDLQRAVELFTAVLAAPGLPAGEEAIDAGQARLVRAVANIELGGLSAAGERAPLYEAALRDCSEVISENPRVGAAHYQQGIALRLLGRFREAVAAFSQALRLAPENTEARIRRGIAWYHLDEFDLALDDFREVGALPGDARPSFWTGIIHAQRGDHLEAIRAYSEAVDENSRYRLAYSNRSLSLMRLGHWQRAIDDLNAMIQLNPEDAPAYRRRALAQQQLGRIEEARRSLAKATELSRE